MIHLTAGAQLRCSHLRFLVGAIFVLSSFALLAQEQDRGLSVLVKKTSIEHNVVLVSAEINDVSVQMTCFQKEPDCAVLKEGPYDLERISSEKGKYQDCQNVYVYKKRASDERPVKLGEYCLLTK